MAVDKICPFTRVDEEKEEEDESKMIHLLWAAILLVGVLGKLHRLGFLDTYCGRCNSCNPPEICNKR